MSSRFSKRSCEAELLDAPHIPRQLLFQNLRELDTVNRLLGGHAITLKGMERLLTDQHRTYRIVDIGCGGGDAMKQIAIWAKKKGIKVELTGVDLNQDVIDYMKKFCEDRPEIKGVVSDYRDYLKANTDIDIIHCSLFCHHLKDEELKELLSYMQVHAKVGFVINDLHRHWFAYYSIKFLTRLLNGSALVKNDAPLSVLRGFRRGEWLDLLENANVRSHAVEWKWAFRHLVIHHKTP